MRLHIDFDEYKRLGEPEKAEKSEIWQIAIGLQAVDGLIPSEYLVETAKQNIEGKITIYKVQERLNDCLRAFISLQEKSFVYRGLSKEQIVEHITKFVSGLWQIHAFGEGNTRTTAVFVIKYLRTLGFPVTNDLFYDHSRYFRNALVRANYNDYKNNIYSTLEFLNCFFGNLLLGESNPLKNRDLRVSSENGTDVPVNVPIKRKATILKMLLVNPNLTAKELYQSVELA